MRRLVTAVDAVREFSAKVAPFAAVVVHAPSAGSALPKLFARSTASALSEGTAITANIAGFAAIALAMATASSRRFTLSADGHPFAPAARSAAPKKFALSSTYSAATAFVDPLDVALSVRTARSAIATASAVAAASAMSAEAGATVHTAALTEV